MCLNEHMIWEWSSLDYRSKLWVQRGGCHFSKLPQRCAENLNKFKVAAAMFQRHFSRACLLRTIREMGIRKWKPLVVRNRWKWWSLRQHPLLRMQPRRARLNGSYSWLQWNYIPERTPKWFKISFVFFIFISKKLRRSVVIHSIALVQLQKATFSES